jgi:hypothetical protein
LYLQQGKFCQLPNLLGNFRNGWFDGFYGLLDGFEGNHANGLLLSATLIPNGTNEMTQRAVKSSTCDSKSEM